MSATPVTQNRTSFYAPLWTDNYSHFCSQMSEDTHFTTVDKVEEPQYLLPYIRNIYKDDKLYSVFELKTQYFPELCMYKEKLGLEYSPKLERVRAHCLSSGCVFIEFSVVYDNLTIEEVENFSYRFKKAAKTDIDNGYTVTMLDFIHGFFLKEKSAEFNFTGAGFKQECLMFHQIFVEQKPDRDTVTTYLKHLARGYNSNFLMPDSYGDYDMVYIPYDYDCWAGSQEGLVNLFSHAGDEYTDKYYIDSFKRCQLENNYSFLYILLLNQRFTSIRLISEITNYEKCKRKQKEKINKRIVELKTVFAFNIVSDDQLYQNVYKRMYGLLDIDRLLDDIKDNEQQVEVIRNYESLEAEKKTSHFLFVLSILSIFSVLIDAATYFDRIPLLRDISTALSFVCMITIIATYIIWWIRYLNK